MVTSAPYLFQQPARRCSLRDLFQRHRKTEIGDVYVMAGLDLETLAYAVRKLTIRRERSNVDAWETF